MAARRRPAPAAAPLPWSRFAHRKAALKAIGPARHRADLTYDRWCHVMAATWGVIDSPMAAVRLTYGATTHDAWRAGVTPVQFARRLVVLAAAAPRWPNGTRKVVEFGA